MDLDGLEPKQFYSPILNARRSLVAWRPLGVAADQRLPVIYLLHGMHGYEWDWILMGDAPETTARLIREGVMAPTMLVMVNDGMHGNGTGYVNWAAGNRRFEESLLNELLAFVDTTWTTRTDRASRWIGGVSLGGYGATHLAWNHPDLFSKVFALSSVFDAEYFARHCNEEVFQDERDMSAHSPLAMVKDLLSAAQLPYYLACGLDDSLLAQNRALAAALERTGYPCFTYEEFPGGHTWDFWTAHLETALRWLTTQ